MGLIFILFSLLAPIVIVQDVLGCDVKLEVTPARTVALLEEPVNISCDIVVNIREIMLLTIAKDNEGPFVIMRQGSNDVMYGNQDIKYVKAEGRTDHNSTRKYLSVTLLQPKKGDTGLYTCTAIFVDEKSAMRHKTASANLTVEVNLDQKRLEVVLTHVLARLSTLESEGSRVWQDISKLSNTDYVVLDKLSALSVQTHNQSEQILDLRENAISMTDNITQQTAKLQELQAVTSHHNDVIDSVEKTKSNLQRDIGQLKKKATYKSAFSATLTSNLRLYAGQVVKFPNVQMSVGGDYDRYSGVYTAPVKGIYTFHFSFGLRDGGDGAYISIQMNGVQMVTTHAFEDGHDDHSACSTVLSLVPGDRVMVVVKSIYASSTHMEHYHRLSVFSGCLVHPL